MKKILLWSLLCLLGSFSAAPLQAKGPSKEDKAEKKANERAQNQLLFEKAAQALSAGKFVVEIDRVLPTTNAKTNTFVVPNTVFVSREGSQGMVQGMAGLGLINLTGEVSRVKTSTSKKGEINYLYTIQGNTLNTTIYITLPYGNNTAIVRVGKSVAYGKLVPSDESAVFKNKDFVPVPVGFQR